MERTFGFQNKLRIVVLSVYVFCSSYSLFSQSMMLYDKPDSFKRAVLAIRWDNEFPINSLVTGASVLIDFQDMKHSAFYLEGSLYSVVSDEVEFERIHYPSNSDYKSLCWSVDAAYTFFFAKRYKVKSASVATGRSGDYVQSIFVESKRRIDYGIRLGVTLNKLPVYARNADYLGLKTFRDEDGNPVLYYGQFRTQETSGLAFIGFQRRKTMHYRINALDMFNSEYNNHTRAKARDFYIDITHAFRKEFADVYDDNNLIEKTAIGPKTYSLRAEDNAISTIGWRVGLRYQNLFFWRFGTSAGFEFGCRYGINSSSFSFANNSIYYTKISLGIILCRQPDHAANKDK